MFERSNPANCQKSAFIEEFIEMLKLMISQSDLAAPGDTLSSYCKDKLVFSHDCIESCANFCSVLR